MSITLLMFYLLVVNMVTFVLYGIDKYKARKNKWRISEKTLLLWAIFGGAIGALLGIRCFHHKTLHKKFKYGIPMILFLQIACVVAVVWKYFHP